MQSTSAVTHSAKFMRKKSMEFAALRFKFKSSRTKANKQRKDNLLTDNDSTVSADAAQTAKVTDLSDGITWRTTVSATATGTATATATSTSTKRIRGEKLGVGASVKFNRSVPTKPIQQVKRVYLYLQLQSIENLPESEPRLSIGITHNSTKIKDIRAVSDEKSTFIIAITQDNIDEANLYSDSPLLITLYETYFSYDAGKSHTDIEMHHRPIAQGNIDLLPFFTNTRSIHNVKTFLYPTRKSRINVYTGTCQVNWHIYSLKPLLDKLNFSNTIFLTFESIYNAEPEMRERVRDLIVAVSFQSKTADNQNQYEKHKICEFVGFSEVLIIYQDVNSRWASLFDDETGNTKHLGQLCGCQVATERIFHNLLCTENANFNFETISVNEDFALVCNAIHRYVMTQKSTSILQELIAFDEQELLLEVHYKDEPNEILLTGVVDLSIFMYPNVNACRFAVELKPTLDALMRLSESDTEFSYDNWFNAENVTFAIINICLMVPLSENRISTAMFDRPLSDAFDICMLISEGRPKKNITQICEEGYIRFDEEICALVDYIVQNGITTIEGINPVLCCHITNLKNQIMKLISCDFNIRFPTKTNVEFTNLMTIVHKELMLRISSVIDKCEKSSPERTLKVTKLQLQQQILKYMTSIKILHEAGDDDLANIFRAEIEKLNLNDHCIEFYECLYMVEKQNFGMAKMYLAKPQRDRYRPGEQFIGLIEIYINYVELLKNEDVYNKALQYVLKELQDYGKQNPQTRSCWILMHCLYKLCGYLPGASYTRWKYENVAAEKRQRLPPIPMSLWNIYLKYTINAGTIKLLQYSRTIQLFLNLGLYKFAEIVFEAIAQESSDMEVYSMRTTFKIIQNELPTEYALEKFKTDRYFTLTIVPYLQSHINGNVHYFLGAMNAAMDEYNNIVNSPAPETLKIFQLSVWRYGYYMFHKKQFQKAFNAFASCDFDNSSPLMQHYIMGRSMYRLNKLEEAESYFSKCTNYDIEIPDAWAFLALINIRMGRTYQALKSWKRAKVDPEYQINQEILEELDKIKPDQLSLDIDKEKL